MPVTAFEVALQTLASIVSYYLKYEKGVHMITKDGMDRLVNEQFPNCKKEETRPGVYEINLGQQHEIFSPLVCLSWDKFLLEAALTLAEKFR